MTADDRLDRATELDGRGAIVSPSPDPASQPADVLAAYRLLADHAARNPWSGLAAQHPGTDVATDLLVNRAARILRGGR